MLLFIHMACPWLSPFIADNELKTENCYKNEGTAILPIHVHLDTMAIAMLSTVLQKPAQEAVESFFGGIFDTINEKLQRFGVQIRGFFYQIQMQSLGVPYDIRQCIEPAPLATRLQISISVMQSLLRTKTLLTHSRMAYLGNKKPKGSNLPELGSRLIVYFCPNILDASQHTYIRAGKCDVAVGILFGAINTLKKTVENTIYTDFLGVSLNSRSFRDDLCSKARKCYELVPDLKAVRHFDGERYLIQNNELLREHDLYDDMFFHQYKNKQGRLKIFS